MSATPEILARDLIAARASTTQLLPCADYHRLSLQQAYCMQRSVIELWPAEIGGWKIGRLPHGVRSPGLSERFIGPIFANTIRRRLGSVMNIPLKPRARSAVEAEFLVELGSTVSFEDIANDDHRWTELIANIHVGIELAGNDFCEPVPSDSFAQIAAFGNNRGLIIGDRIPRECYRLPLSVRTVIDGKRIGTADANPLAIVAKALADAAREAHTLNVSLQPGQWIATGALTGIHQMSIDQNAVVQFTGYDWLELITSDISLLAQPPRT